MFSSKRICSHFLPSSLIASALFSQASIISRSPSTLRARPFRTPRGITFCAASLDYLLSVFSKACFCFLIAKALFSAASIISLSPSPLSFIPHRWSMPWIITRCSSCSYVAPIISLLLRTVSSEIKRSPLIVSPSQ